jgi:hypothetical protein
LTNFYWLNYKKKYSYLVLIELAVFYTIEEQINEIAAVTRKDKNVFFFEMSADPIGKSSGRGAARLAHLLGVQGVAGSNPAVPTNE